jgi:hypothetical protein
MPKMKNTLTKTLFQYVKDHLTVYHNLPRVQQKDLGLQYKHNLVAYRFIDIMRFFLSFSFPVSLFPLSFTSIALCRESRQADR